MGKKRKILICTVGFTPESIILGINDYKPDYCIFLPSDKSKDKIGLILDSNQLTYKSFKYEQILLKNVFDFQQCIKDSRDAVNKALSMVSNENDICVNFISGTSIMTAGITIASYSHNLKGMYYKCEDYDYVGDPRGKCLVMYFRFQESLADLANIS